MMKFRVALAMNVVVIMALKPQRKLVMGAHLRVVLPAQFLLLLVRLTHRPVREVLAHQIQTTVEKELHISWVVMMSVMPIRPQTQLAMETFVTRHITTAVSIARALPSVMVVVQPLLFLTIQAVMEVPPLLLSHLLPQPLQLCLPPLPLFLPAPFQILRV